MLELTLFVESQCNRVLALIYPQNFAIRKSIHPKCCVLFDTCSRSVRIVVNYKSTESHRLKSKHAFVLFWLFCFCFIWFKSTLPDPLPLVWRFITDSLSKYGDKTSFPVGTMMLICWLPNTETNISTIAMIMNVNLVGDSIVFLVPCNCNCSQFSIYMFFLFPENLIYTLNICNSLFVSYRSDFYLKIIFSHVFSLFITVPNLECLSVSRTFFVFSTENLFEFDLKIMCSMAPEWSDRLFGLC